MKLIISCLACLLAVFISAEGACGSNPLSVVQALVEAERAADLDAAVALFADNAFISNVVGWKTTNRDELRWFISTEIWMRDDFGLDHPRVDGNRVYWDEAAVGSFYQGIGVAPVRFTFVATIERGKIKSIVAHLPEEEIARIREGCNAQATEPLIYGRSCSEFVHLVEAHTSLRSHAVRPKP